jgi:hypothetical protein
MSYKEGILKAIKGSTPGFAAVVIIKELHGRERLAKKWSKPLGTMSYLSANHVIVGDLDKSKTANYKLSNKFCRKCRRACFRTISKKGDYFDV